MQRNAERNQINAQTLTRLGKSINWPWSIRWIPWQDKAADGRSAMGKGQKPGTEGKNRNGGKKCEEAKRAHAQFRGKQKRPWWKIQKSYH